jgi:hypothetical protein
LAPPEGGDPSKTPALKYKLISRRNKNTKCTNDQGHARFGPHDDNGAHSRKDLRKLNNSTQDLRATSAPKPGTTRDKRPSKPQRLLCTKSAHRKRKSMQQRRVSDDQCRRAQTPPPARRPLLEAEHSVRWPAHSVSSVSLNAKPCMAAIAGCVLEVTRVGTRYERAAA